MLTRRFFGAPTKRLAIILTISVLLRVGAALYMGNSVEVLPGTYDQVSYHALSLRVLEGHGFSFGSTWWPLTAADAPTAHWSFLYTLYLTAMYALFGPNPLVARLCQAVIVGLFQPLLAFLIGRHVFGERAGLWAAGFTAIYIYFIYYAATLMTEPFYIVAIMGALYILLNLRRPKPGQEFRLAIILGVILGTTILLRQVFLLIVPVLVGWLWVARYLDGRRPLEGQQDRGSIRSIRWPWQSSIIVIVLIALMILPFTLYNLSRFDRFVLLNTNAGYAFFWANHPVYGTRFQAILPPQLGTYQDLIPAELRHLDEAALEAALMTRGLEFVRQDPLRYVLLSISRIPVYFMFWPSSESGTISNLSRVGSFALFLPLMLGGLVYSVASARLRRSTLRDSSLLLVFIMLYTGVHLASWALIRYRLPVDAVLLLYAGLAAAGIWSAIEKQVIGRHTIPEGTKEFE